MTLKQAREAKGVTQEYLAKRINVTQTAVSKWENGDPTHRKYRKLIAKVLGVKVEDIEWKERDRNA